MLLKTKILYFVFFLFFGIFLPACQSPPVRIPAFEDMQIKNEKAVVQQGELLARLKEESQAQALSYEIIGRSDLEKEKQADRLADTIVTRSDSSPLKQRSQAWSLDPAAVYQKALSVLLAGDAFSARKTFMDFQKKWPESPLIPNVLYWLGESYYLQQEYGAALLRFKKVWECYPEHPKASDSMLKAAYSCLHLKNMENAKLYLQTILHTYPHSRSAVLALCKLRAL